MKHLRLALTLTVAAFIATWSVAAADSYDSETATIQKKTDKVAKVEVGKDTFTTPISFDDGADWSSVKDHYELTSEGVSGLQSGKSCISVGSDGTLTYKANQNSKKQKK